MKTIQSKTELALRLIPSLTEQDWSERVSKSVKFFKKKKFKRIVFIGTGSSLNVCELSMRFVQAHIDRDIKVLHTWNALYEEFKPLTTDLVILVTHRGYRGLTEKFIKTLKNKSNIVLVSAKDAPVGSVQSIGVSETEQSHAHTMSLFGAFFGIVAFTSALFISGSRQHIQKNLNQLSEALTLTRNEVLAEGFFELMISKNVRTITCVGAGVFESLASECALKFREIAHLPALKMGLEEVLHGPIVSMNSKDVIMLLPTLRQYKNPLKKFLFNERTSSFVEKLEKTGAELRVPKLSRELVALIEPMDEPFQAMAILYWMQWSILGIAYEQNVNPDVNPYL